MNQLNKKKSDMSGDGKQGKNPADAAQKTSRKPQEIPLALMESQEWSRYGISGKMQDVIQH